MAADRPIADMQVVVADDNRDGADALTELLRLELGCRVVTAYDGEQALQLAQALSPDALILDLQMPGLSGLDVASRAARGRGASPRPLMLAMTGRSDLVGELAAIDGHFDRAFAKPLDYTTLFATLRAHWHGGRAPRAPVQFRFFDTFTRAAREVLPLLAVRRQQLSFDGEGPELTLSGDEAALHSAFYRLMCGALELIGSGIVMFGARSDAAGETCALTVNVAGSGRLESPARTAEVLQRLGLVVDVAASSLSGADGFVRASGICPNTGGEVSFASQQSEGILLRLALSVRPVELEPPPAAEGARAWIVDGRNIAPAVLQRRLQRLGWRVWRFASSTDTARHLNTAAADTCPELLLIRDDPLTSRSAILALQNRMPERTRCLLLVGAGSALLRDPGALPGFDVRVEPLSPGDLAEATLLAVDADHARAGAVTVSHSLRGRRKVLVVDDHEVNRIVASGLLQALGYEVASVADGLDAVEHCKLTPPDAVLMDVNMPVLGGIDASRRILELQRLGRVPPFAIVVATADDAPETMARCFEAGVSGYLCKPLRLEVMRDELRRVGVPATVDPTTERTST